MMPTVEVVNPFWLLFNGLPFVYACSVVVVAVMCAERIRWDSSDITLFDLWGFVSLVIFAPVVLFFYFYDSHWGDAC